MVVFKKLHNFILFLVLSKDEGIPGHVKEKNTLGFINVEFQDVRRIYFQYSQRLGFEMGEARKRVGPHRNPSEWATACLILDRACPYLPQQVTIY